MKNAEHHQINKLAGSITLLIILTILTILISCRIRYAIFLHWLTADPDSVFHPLISDEELVTLFNENKEQFVILSNMLSSEKEIVAVYPNTNQCQTLDQERIDAIDNQSCQAYITIFQNLGFNGTKTMLWAGGENIRFNVDNYGLIPGGQSKGYYYSPGGPEVFGILSPDTDYTAGQFVYHYLEGDWYIYHLR